jgi:phosphatidylserine/phosphatidylglycerophosphate/cardiolipin synthase-like enzyme
MVIMAKLLNTSAANYYLEEIIRLAQERLVLITPLLKFNDHLKELLEDKNRMKVDIRLLFGKTELQPEEINWLRGLPSIRTSFCRNLHAKCYLNQDLCIVTSLNLHDFTQVNNSEMGILISREDDSELFEQANEEAQRLIRVSDEVRMTFDKVKRVSEDNAPHSEEELEGTGKLSTSRLAKKLGLKTQELTDHLLHLGAIEISDGQKQITPLGRRLGGELRVSARFGPYFLWPEALPLAKA